MNKRIKKLWVAALRSGEYDDNVAGVLRNKLGFDPLGVLCDLHQKETQKEEWLQHLVMPYFTYTSDWTAWNTLSQEVVEWAGIPEADFDQHLVPIMYKGKMTNVAALHDGMNLTWKEIADLIQRKL